MPLTATKPFVASKLFHKAGEGSGGGEAVITSLSVTPTTSAQTITAPSGIDGYSPVNVEAVTSSIDANITAGNIKDGVSILGVSGNVTELNGSTETVTPTTSQQTVTPTSPSNGLTSVTVNAVTSSIDANIVAGNIKDGVTILGVTGNYQGQTPTGTMYIISNGTYNVSDKAIANVQVPTTAPDYYIAKTKDANNVLQKGSTVIDCTGLDKIGPHALPYAYYFNTNITSADMSSITSIDGPEACTHAFSNSGITSIDLSNLESIKGDGACSSMFDYCPITGELNLNKLNTVTGGCASMFASCTSITSAKIGALKQLTGSFATMFNNDTGLVSVDLGGLTHISGNGALTYCFSGCSSLTTVNLSSLMVLYKCTYTFQNCTSLATINLSSVLAAFDARYAFSGCSNLTSVDISKMAWVRRSDFNFTYTFQNCTLLTELRFSGMPYSANNLNTCFNNMLSGVTGCTVHFPADWQTSMSSWASVTAGFGGTNTTVLWDLPSVTTLDLSVLTKSSDFTWNPIAFPNVTTVNLSNLTTIDSAIMNWFGNFSSLTTVNLSSLATITANLYYVFYNCTSLTELRFPALTSVSSVYVFSNMLQECSGVTVHFPSNFPTTVTASDVGGTNTTVLYDLPAA